MRGEKIQEKIDKGYKIASNVVGLPFDVFRSASLINPLDQANLIGSQRAAFPTNLKFNSFSKPKDPFCVAVVDRGAARAGDWFSNGEKVYFIAEIQHIVPVPAIECNAVVSIARPAFGTAVDGGYEATDETIASALPVFMINKSDSTSAPGWLGVDTETIQAIAAWTFYINTRDPAAIKAHDVIIDSQGVRYQITTPHATPFGVIATAKLEAP